MRCVLTLALALACGCTEKSPAGPAAWKEAFLDTGATAQWGYVHADGYHALGDPQTLGWSEVRALRELVRRAGPGPFKCIVHIDARLVAGDITAEVCTSCGIFIVGGKQWGVGGTREELLRLLEGALGPRPPEPPDPRWEGL